VLCPAAIYVTEIDTYSKQHREEKAMRRFRERHPDLEVPLPPAPGALVRLGVERSFRPGRERCRDLFACGCAIGARVVRKGRRRGVHEACRFWL
jgi:hypothetical protein